MFGWYHSIKGVPQRPAVKDISRKSPCETYIYIHGWVRRRHVSEKHRHPGPIGATLIMRLEGIPKLFWKNNANLQPKHELAW